MTRNTRKLGIIISVILFSLQPDTVLAQGAEEYDKFLNCFEGATGPLNRGSYSEAIDTCKKLCTSGECRASAMKDPRIGLNAPPEFFGYGNTTKAAVDVYSGAGGELDGGGGTPDAKINPPPALDPKSQLTLTGADSIPDYDSSQCKQASAMATRCCGKPETCMGEPSVDESKDDTIGGRIVGMLGSAALSVPGSVSQMCGRMKSVGQVMTALNGYLAYKCQDKVALCRKACDPITKDLERRYKLADDDAIKEKIGEEYSKFDSASDVCASSNNASWQMAQQAIGNQLGAKFADMCKNATSTNPTATDDFANPNCNSPANATTPMCQSYCTRPGGRNDPNCAGYFAAIGGGQNGNGRAETSKSSASLFNIPNDPEGDQFADPQDIAANGRKAPTMGGGGGVSLGGGGDAGGGGGDYGSGGGGGDGYNTKIDRGLNSGNGYSVGSLRTGGGGGFSGYGSGGAITDKGGKPFSLKDFLPGGDKNKLKFRGLASALPDVSPAHTDIFKKVSDRFFQICQRDALYDCSTLKKMKRAGN